MWCHLVNPNKTEPARAERIRARSAINTADRAETMNRAHSAINLRPQDGYLQLVTDKMISHAGVPARLLKCWS